MRPTKLTQLVIDTFQEVLNEWHNALVCTDFELCFLLNERLPHEQRISYRTFQRYKAQALRIKQELVDGVEEDDNDEIPLLDNPDWYEDTTAETCTEAELMPKMFRLWQIAIIRQKNMLVEHMTKDRPGWTRFSWLLQRKFKEWA